MTSDFNGYGHGARGPFVGGYDADWQIPPQVQRSLAASRRRAAQPALAASRPAQPSQQPPQWREDQWQEDAADDLGAELAPTGGARGFGSAASTATSLLGAALSIALIGGMAVWGYKLLVRDVSGVPVVVALEGPMRIAPEDPGGRTAAHQGLAVNAIAADGQAEAPADRLVLAPRPVELAPEDQPRAQIAPVAVENIDDDAGDNAPVQTSAEADEMRAAPSSDPVAVALALADAVAAGAAPLSSFEAPEAQDMDEDGAGEDASPQLAVIDVPAGGIRRSPIPAARPSGLREAAAQARAASAAAPASSSGALVTEIDPSSISAGTKLVQFGAYDSADVARAEWDKLTVNFPDFLSDKARVIQKAQSGGKTFYRLRAAGFDDLADARRFCAALVAKNAGCIPAVAR